MIVQVYFSEPAHIGPGRYIALCDKSKTNDVARVSSSVGPHRPSDDAGSKSTSDMSESFETVEYRRTRSVLEDLRSCCKTDKALKSFEKFEVSLLAQRSGVPLGISRPSIASKSTATSETKTPATNKPRHPWPFWRNLKPHHCCQQALRHLQQHLQQ